MNDLDDFWIHTVQVETYTGQQPDGSDGYTDPIPVTGFLDQSRTLARTSSGEEVVSSTTFYAPLDVQHLFPDLTRVTIRPGVVAEVVTVSPQDSGDLGLPDHVVVSLT